MVDGLTPRRSESTSDRRGVLRSSHWVHDEHREVPNHAGRERGCDISNCPWEGLVLNRMVEAPDREPVETAALGRKQQRGLFDSGDPRTLGRYDGIGTPNDPPGTGRELHLRLQSRVDPEFWTPE